MVKKKSKKKAAKKTRTKTGTSKKTKQDKKVEAAVNRDESAQVRVEKIKIAVGKARNYTASRLTSQLIETLIDELRAMDALWHKTPESSQKVIIARMSDRIAKSMKEAVRILAASGHSAVVCNLVSVTFKDGVRGVISVAPGSDQRHALADHATKDVVLVLADPGKFMQGIEDIKADADQPKLL